MTFSGKERAVLQQCGLVLERSISQTALKSAERSGISVGVCL